MNEKEKWKSGQPHNKYVDILKLQILLFFFSLFGIVSKLAAGEKILSLHFCIYYGIVLVNLLVYAIVWQQCIKNLSIVTAYCNKVSVIIWGMIFGRLFFDETITINKIIGGILAIIGAVFVIQGERKDG